MVEIEVPIEKVQEDIHHAATHGQHSSQDSNRLMMAGALISAILAVFAAISALKAGHFANEAMILQIQSSDQWSFYQAKGIKASITELKVATESDSKKRELFAEKLNKYKEEQEEIKKEAELKHHESEHLLARHEKLAMAVTFFQIAIAMTAISVLTRKTPFLFISGALVVMGVLGLIQGLFLS